MLRQTRRIALGVFLALIVFNASAAAECAWVLWTGGLLQGGDWVWDIHGAHPDLRACSEDLVGLAKTYRSEGYEVSGVFPGARSTAYRKGQRKGVMQCLPDTMDPRGPKGK